MRRPSSIRRAAARWLRRAANCPDPLNVPPGCPFASRCPYVFERCRVERPVLTPRGGGQRAACHLTEFGARRRYPTGRHSLMSFATFETEIAKINDILCAVNLLTWDSRTMMPPGGVEARGKQIATLVGLARDLATSDEVQRAIEGARTELRQCS